MREVFAARKGIIFGHIVPTRAASEGTDVQAGEPIGEVAPLPKERSPRYDEALRRSESQYKDGDHLAAAASLEEAYANERSNPFVLNAYARALYRLPQRWGDSFIAYSELISLLDRVGAAINPEYVYIDYWFVEAYWKLGTIHLDRAAYREAIFEIARSIGGGAHRTKDSSDPFLQQALGYLTEAYFFLKRYDLAQLFAREARRLYPQDTYVVKFLEAISELQREHEEQKTR